MTLIDGAALRRLSGHAYAAETDPVYWNAVGPFGGWIAALFVRCVALESEAGFAPLSLSLQFAGPMQAGGFEIRPRTLRANRSTRFWSLELVQRQDGVETLCAFATIVTARRRESPEFFDLAAPVVAPPEGLHTFAPSVPLPFLKRLDMRHAGGTGPMPQLVDGQTVAWARSRDADAFDFETLTALCDCGLPQIFLRLRRPVPVSSVTMNVFYHASAEKVAAVGPDFVLTASRMRAATGGFFDASTALWTRAGALLATTEQVVWFKASG